jgi:hypothetical protein
MLEIFTGMVKEIDLKRKSVGLELKDLMTWE